MVFSVTVIVMMVFSGISHSRYVVVDLKLLEAALRKKARFHGGSKISLKQDLHQRHSAGVHFKLYCRCIKRTSVNFNSKERQGQFYSANTQEHTA